MPFIIILFLTPVVWAGPQDEVRGILVENVDTNSPARELPVDEKLDVLVSPSDSAEAQREAVDLNELYKESELMRSEAYQLELKSKVIIPKSIENLGEIEDFKRLSQEDLEKFLAKKTYHLERLARLLKFLRVGPAKTNAALRMVNREIFKKAGVFANHDTSVTTYSFGISTGLSNVILTQLKKLKYLKDIPYNRPAFYFSLSFGVSLAVTHLNGKTKVRIELVSDFKKGTHFDSMFAFVAIGPSWSQSFENRQLENRSIQKSSFYKVSFVNMMESLSQVSFTVPFAFTFPPGGGIAAIIVGDNYRLRFTKELLKDVYQRMIRIFPAAFRREALSSILCEKIF